MPKRMFVLDCSGFLAKAERELEQRIANFNGVVQESVILTFATTAFPEDLIECGRNVRIAETSRYKC